jgi:hypothetical protein
MKPFIGVGGQKGNGKSTLTRILLKELNTVLTESLDIPETSFLYKWSQAKFSLPIKIFLAELMGKSVDWIERHKDHPPPPGWTWNVRKSLEYIGVGMAQANPTVWLDRSLSISHSRTISDDVRRPVELSRIKELGGYTILVWRPGKENPKAKVETESALWPLLNRHIKYYKKTLQDGCLGLDPRVDYFLVNEGSRPRLRSKVISSLIPAIKTYKWKPLNGR